MSVIGDGTIVRIDPATGKIDQTVTFTPKGSEPEGLAWDGKSLWVVDQAHDRVLQLDGDGKLLDEFKTDDGPRLVATGRNGTWVTNYGASSLSRIRDGKVTTASVPACVGPQGVVEAAGRVWVACTLSGKAVGLSARTLRPQVTLEIVPDADAVAAAGDKVYVVGQSGPTVYVVDAASGILTDVIKLDDAVPTTENVGVAVVGDSLVITHPDVQRIYTLPLP